MDFLPYLLPLLLLVPIIFNRLAEFNPKFHMNQLQFISPVIFLGLTFLCYLNGRSFELNLFNFSSIISLDLKLDILSGMIAATVSTIGIVVSRFSVRYLADDPNQLVFSRNLSKILFFVLFMLMATNLILLFLSWLGISYYLHKVLTHFSDRAGALKAAHQKFWISRLGDLFIISAGVVMLWTFSSTDFDTISQLVKDYQFVEQNYVLVNVASILLVLGAMTKSAQFPFHYWLPNTMETPLPVSALMHAGIINAGGYLVIRMSPLLSNAPLALSILAIVGGFTAFWATIIMFTQTNIKRSLAFSTIAQMGFMMLQCGLGFFSIAVVHIIGHAFYKAYAFLSSGAAADIGRLNRYFPKTSPSQNFWSMLITPCLSVILLVGGLYYFSSDITDKARAIVLLVVLALAISQIVLNSNNKFKALWTAGVVVVLYLLLTSGMTTILSGIIMNQSASGGIVENITAIVCASFFVTLYIIQNNLSKISTTKMGKIIYVRAMRGGES